MRITVGICTWNRCELLRQALEQMTRLSIPEEVEWELLVVNNNSTDATDRVIATFKDRLPLRGLFEPKPGKSNALNLAAREARGEYIIWTDDDALVDEEWIVAYCRAFRRWPEAGLFGGPVEPWFDGTPPPWLQQAWPRVASAYAVRDLGGEPLAFTQEVVPFGVNMAVRRAEQMRYLYDPSLGPRPNSTLRGEEVTMIREMLAAGVKGWWVPDARVRHYIPQERQTLRYLRGFFFGLGQLYSLTKPDTQAPKLFGRPRWLWRQALESEIKYRLHRVLSSPEVWMEDLRISSETWGQIRSHALKTAQ